MHAILFNTFLFVIDDYIKARKKLSDAEFTSDIQTEAEEIDDGKRKKRFKIILICN